MRCRVTPGSGLMHQGGFAELPGRQTLRAGRDTRLSIILLIGGTMAGKNVTRVELCEAVYNKVGLSRSESLAIVGLVLNEITDTLAKGETVKLSSFGSFIVRKKKLRI